MKWRKIVSIQKDRVNINCKPISREAVENTLWEFAWGFTGPFSYRRVQHVHNLFVSPVSVRLVIREEGYGSGPRGAAAASTMCFSRGSFLHGETKFLRISPNAEASRNLRAMLLPFPFSRGYALRSGVGERKHAKCLCDSRHSRISFVVDQNSDHRIIFKSFKLCRFQF